MSQPGLISNYVTSVQSAVAPVGQSQQQHTAYSSSRRRSLSRSNSTHIQTYTSILHLLILVLVVHTELFCVMHEHDILTLYNPHIQSLIQVQALHKLLSSIAT